MAFWGITAKNGEQKTALRALSSSKPFTFITGPAGCGKTLLAMAVGLHEVVETQKYRKLIYTRLQTQLGVNLGALPGDIDEKTYPFVAPFLDNFELLSNKDSLEYLVLGDERKRKVFFDPIQTVRGRSIHGAFLMLDEAQNLDPATIAAIATRIGKRYDGSLSTKFVFLGNFAQTDSPKLRKPVTNGLYRLLAGLYEREAHEYFDHVNLTEVERHPVVNVVEDILRNHEMAPEFAELEALGSVAE